MNKEIITVTVLVENTVSQQDLKAEHGLSFWIETADGNILWDTGQSGLFVSNAQKLGIPLQSTTHIVISHGHYDHTGGLLEVLKQAPHAHVFGHPDMFIQRFSLHSKKPNSITPIGMPFLQHIVEQRCKSLNLNSESVEILPGISTTGEIPRKT
ncbi:MBL fold metallo-hydrolase, partial [Candidatus Omnitrophota bacterium]